MQMGWRGVAIFASSCVILACKEDPAARVASAKATASASATPQAVCPDAEPRACFERASKLDMSGAADKDKEAAISLYAAACDRKLGDACYALGTLHFVGEGSIA